MNQPLSDVFPCLLHESLQRLVLQWGRSFARSRCRWSLLAMNVRVGNIPWRVAIFCASASLFCASAVRATFQTTHTLLVLPALICSVNRKSNLTIRGTAIGPKVHPGSQRHKQRNNKWVSVGTRAPRTLKADNDGVNRASVLGAHTSPKQCKEAFKIQQKKIVRVRSYLSRKTQIGASRPVLATRAKKRAQLKSSLAQTIRSPRADGLQSHLGPIVMRPTADREKGENQLCSLSAGRL